jgi:DNA-binding NtrC family response regulator
MPSSPSLFIVDDDVGFVHAAAELARQKGFDITVAGTKAQAISRLQNAAFDIAVIDVSLPDGSGLDLLEHFDLGERTQAILISGNPTIDSALKALRLPIVDYVLKPIHAQRFGELLDEARSRRKAVPPQPGDLWNGMLGSAPAILELKHQIARVAATEAAVLIQGESGVGKELVARALHSESGRTGEFVALNCGAVPPELLSSQLFGHERGSFTGAHSRQTGFFEQADKGTLFLDEVTEMPLHLQVHLLRALETHTVRRVGGTEDLRVDVRIVSATNRDPEAAIREGRLRGDLYYRLCEFPLHVPALRERGDDIPSLAQLFLARLNDRYGTQRSFAADALQALRRYRWPGNIRELKNVVQRAYILADGDLVHPRIPDRARALPLAETDDTITFAIGTPLHEVEKRMLFKTLAFFDNNKSRAARALGVTAKTIYNRLSAYGQAEAEDGPAGEIEETDDEPERQ